MDREPELPEIALSVHRLLIRIGRRRDEPWENVSPEWASFCVRAARGAIELLQSMEGRKASEIAAAVAKQVGGPLPPLEWEAVVRLVHTEVDCDDEDFRSLDQAEEFWAGWLNEKKAACAT